jgi:hypothetical protein
VSLLLLIALERRFQSSSLCGLGRQFKVGLMVGPYPRLRRSNACVAVHDLAYDPFTHSMAFVAGLEVKWGRP